MESNQNSRRQIQIEKQIQESLASYILKNFNISKDGLVSVTRVQVPKDFKTARVYIHHLGSASQVNAQDPDEVIESVIEKLEKQVGAIQRHVSHELKLKFCPKLQFYYDKGFDKSIAVERSIHELSESGEIKKSESSD